LSRLVYLACLLTDVHQAVVRLDYGAGRAPEGVARVVIPPAVALSGASPVVGPHLHSAVGHQPRRAPRMGNHHRKPPWLPEQYHCSRTASIVTCARGDAALRSISPAHLDNGPEGHSPKTEPVVGWPIKSTLRQGELVSNQLECRARAALCVRLAKREPGNRNLWIAEAQNWSRLSTEISWRDWGKKRFRHLGHLAGAVAKRPFSVGR